MRMLLVPLVYTMLPLFGWARGVVLLSLFSFYRFSPFCPACGRCWLLPGGFTKHFGQLYMNYKFHHPFPALHLLSLNMALLKTLTHPSQIPIGNPNFDFSLLTSLPSTDSIANLGLFFRPFGSVLQLVILEPIG